MVFDLSAFTSARSLFSIISFILLMLYCSRLWKTLCLFDFSMCLICFAARYRKVLCNLGSNWRMATSVSTINSLIYFLGSFSIACLGPKDKMLICSFVKGLSERLITFSFSYLLRRIFTVALLIFWLLRTKFSAQSKLIGLHEIFGMYYVTSSDVFPQDVCENIKKQTHLKKLRAIKTGCGLFMAYFSFRFAVRC